MEHSTSCNTESYSSRGGRVREVLGGFGKYERGGNCVTPRLYNLDLFCRTTRISREIKIGNFIKIVLGMKLFVL